MRGFTLIELALALAVIGLLLVPLTRSLEAAALRKHAEETHASLTAARDALLAYAVRHHGCLPLAADYEGGVPDTGRAGAGSTGTPDTGSVRSAVAPANGGPGQRAGDLPWADLGLAGRALDGQQQRLQYYVASPFTAPLQAAANEETATTTAARDLCPARLRSGIEAWQPQSAYSQGDLVTATGAIYVAATTAQVGSRPPASPWQLFGAIKTWTAGATYNVGDYASDSGHLFRRLTGSGDGQPTLTPALWRPIGLPGLVDLPDWQDGTDPYRRGELVRHEGRSFRVMTTTAAEPLPDSVGPVWQDLSLPDRLLQTRLGPELDMLPGSTVAAAQNVVVLIAPGRDRNTLLDKIAMRDANHLDCPNDVCRIWTSLDDTNVDDRAFSLTAAPGNSPDTLLPVSWGDYAAALQQSGLSPQPLAW